ncbi:MAG: Hsp33 family molecular chaperone HslO [bacterium]|nr:Hsp33 family molecular chaperone HslO [bacterium]
MKDDIISRIICEELNLRVYTVTSLNTVREINGYHEATPNAAVALGRTINAAALVSATLKPGSNQNITIRFSGTGPIKEIHVQADAQGNCRGYAANPLVDLTEDIGKISFSRTIGAGFMTVVKDLGLREPYSSVTPLQSGDVAPEVAYYLTASEQIPSALVLGLNLNKEEGSISSSGGILIQTFPDTEIEAIEAVESNIRSLPHSLGDALEEGTDILAVVSELLNNKPLSILDSHPFRASCRCNKDILKGVFQNLDNEELIDMIEKDKGAEVTCTFCAKQYHFDEEELASFVKK